jgi:hypothetical protein
MDSVNRPRGRGRDLANVAKNRDLPQKFSRAPADRPRRAFRFRPFGQRMMEEPMSKALFVAALMLALGSGQAYAQDLCNDAHMKQMDQMIAKMTDAAKQKEANAALDQSKAAMEAGDTAGCMKYMDEAHKAMGL